jgi:hypothetical protein
MKINLETLEPRWAGPIIVAAPGPSLTREVAEQCRGYPVICIKWAALRMPWASVVYACHQWQWDDYQGYPGFQGERWSCHHRSIDNKIAAAQRWRLRLVAGDGVRATRFSEDPSVVHYGLCSGFAALGFAIHWLRRPGRIAMVGFDFQGEGKRKYFNGEHPRGPQVGGKFDHYRPMFEAAAKHLPEGVEIVNATPESALKCFPQMSLESALSLPKAA